MTGIKTWNEMFPLVVLLALVTFCFICGKLAVHDHLSVNNDTQRPKETSEVIRLQMAV